MFEDDRWYKREPMAWLTGTRMLSPEARGIYADIIELMHIRRGRLLYNAKDLMADFNLRDRRTFDRIIAELVGKEKIQIVEGRITNARVERDIRRRGGRPPGHRDGHESADSRPRDGDEMAMRSPSDDQLIGNSKPRTVESPRQKQETPPPLESDSESEGRRTPPVVPLTDLFDNAAEVLQHGNAPTEHTDRGSRLAEDWRPSDNDRAYAREQGFAEDAIDRIALDFHAYWTSKPGKDARRIHWDRTWQTWIRKEADGPRNGPAAGRGNAGSGRQMDQGVVAIGARLFGRNTQR